MNTVDEKYNCLVKEILTHGEMDNPEKVRTKYADGEKAPTIKIINYQLKFDTTKEVPILTTKRVPLLDPVKEILWIWQKMSNDVRVLQDMGCRVWDEWMRDDGTIGKSYGYQLRNNYQEIVVDDLFTDMFFEGKFSFKPTEIELELGIDGFKKEFLSEEYVIELNQVDYLLYMLKKNPESRRIKTTLWKVSDLDNMALHPCVYETHWILHNGKLNLTVNIRSNDIAVGNPYNIYQYFVLLKMIAQVSDLESGELCFNIDIPHIYDRHIETIKKQIENEQYEQPTFKLNPDIKSFFDFTVKDVIVENYKHNGNVKYEIAI